MIWSLTGHRDPAPGHVPGRQPLQGVPGMLSYPPPE